MGWGLSVLGQVEGFWGGVVDFGAVIVGVVALCVALGVAARFRPVRFVWRRLASEPVSAWARGIVSAEVTTAAQPLRDEMTGLRSDLTSHMAEEEKQRGDLVAALHHFGERVFDPGTLHEFKHAIAHRIADKETTR